MSTVLETIDSYSASRFESTLLLNQIKEAEEEDDCSSSTTTSSWIGMNSDDEDEVQSSFNGGLDTMDSLQQVLPMRRGISSFYNGKSKSFTSLAEASTAEEIAKPENAYTRKRRNLLAINHAWGSKRLKRSIGSTKSTMAFLAQVTTLLPTSCPPLLPPFH
ncbi:hypothetical protein HRI_002931300 [Hibiscus trionum]|uniref:Uncharacterized protein n=1 Tax=Hibiscus trionum TaxID=183268 RepID=A0A9W7IDS9_HIBTR|nr:hypothetical protein HRI_002931300 [Hibiscus trionum]